MNPTMIENAVKVFGKPSDWIEERDGPCLGLPIKFERQGGIQYMVSAWTPTPDELAAIKRGASVRLWISAPVHPVVALTVGPIPGQPSPVEGLTRIDIEHPLAQQIEVWDEDKGIPLDRWVREVDVENGWADCYSLDPSGAVRMDGDSPIMHRLTGRFSIRWKQEAV